MEVGKDASTKQALLSEEADESAGASSPPRGSSWRPSARRRGTAPVSDRYALLQDSHDEGRAEGMQFYECEEGEEDPEDATELSGCLAASAGPSGGTVCAAVEVASAAASSAAASSAAIEEDILEEVPLESTESTEATRQAGAVVGPAVAAGLSQPQALALPVASPALGSTAGSLAANSRTVRLSARAAAPVAAPGRDVEGLASPSGPSGEDGIEMRDFSVPVGTPRAYSLTPTSDRHCFICLQEDDRDKDHPLVSCCTTCFARTHVRCWREWRNNQRVTALRSRLLGLRMQTNHLLRCTICKSGTALVEGEEDRLEWMNELICGGGGQGGAPAAAGDDNGRPGGPLAAIRMRREDSDEDHDAQLDDLVDMRTCLALVVYLVVMVLVLFVTCMLILLQRFYAGDVVLCCIIALYELSVLQVVVLAVARRRGAMVAARTTGGEDGSSPPRGLNRSFRSGSLLSALSVAGEP
eukprot:CAMPEP_0170609630 /NCGR_PEP_ID=MMETSP0224-20130122/22228_1 /TAXON_ID=285029 /ORGANISM="Togula jolla, Strain CCCM 725" /LENGTH=469 /DNA_ID=CAMNT_0010934951 /DNA_START=60 /DNA_END=1469 /DNA_ORIENTATION=-